MGLIIIVHFIYPVLYVAQEKPCNIAAIDDTQMFGATFTGVL